MPSPLKINDTDYNELGNALREIDSREDVLVTVWQAHGKWFCAGTDVKGRSGGAPPNVRQAFLANVVSTTTDCGHALSSHTKILVAALNGPVMGIAAAFLGHFDFIYCMPNVWISTPFTFLGIVAEGGSSASFVNRMGLAKANEVLLWGKKKGSQELLDCDLAPLDSQIFPEQSINSFHSAVRRQLLEELHGLDPTALLEVKRLIRAGLRDKNDPDAVNLRESYDPDYLRATEANSVLPKKPRMDYSEEKKIRSDIDISKAIDEALLEPPIDDSLHRGLKARQISMIALGGAVGTGLIIGSGTALQRGGPLGYSFVGFVCYLVMVALGEMASFLPHKKGFAGYATRFVDPALGFALGWNYLIKYLIVTPNNINAAGVVVQYWTQKVHIAVWMASVIFILFIFFVNLLGVRVFGELEFWFSSIKGTVPLFLIYLKMMQTYGPVISLVGLLLMGIIIDLGGNPQHDRIGFRYWRAPNGPMGTYLKAHVHDGHLAIFLGFWATMTNALFAYIGTELIGVTVGEAENPRRNIPIAIRRTFFRILVFYIGGVFVIGLIVPSTDNTLFLATKSKTGAAASPFVVATTLVGIKVLNHVINAAILIFVMSAANSDLYIGSRTLYGLAVEGKAPAIFKRVNRLGVPYPSLIVCTLFCGLVFLNVKSSSAKVFTWFVNLVSTAGALTWMCIAFCHIRFMKALKVHGLAREELPYKAPFQPWGSWFALIATAVITIFKGFDTFIPFTVDTFITSYIIIPTFVVFWLGYKLYHKTRLIPLDQVDLVTGKQQIDEEEEKFLAAQAALGPRSTLQQFWDSL
ncbi:hypothetical protein C0991_008215 [Blastosporella zonata]|nr:hypothetical protein C0991_008215 [Blastosporella zonata]